ncbi:MAG: ABC transporter permease subunit [Bdellovibrionales bacterium]|nr:ABC transporter permease [Bdellovibrionales bacterium]NQZ18268.1 ABC transporter permease subunit [Bdellovibrionales bacterium]
MMPVLAIIKKDLKAFLLSPMFYLLAGLCALLWGAFFAFDFYNFVRQSYELRAQTQEAGLNLHQHLVAGYVVVVHYVLVFIIAALTMKFFAEEKKLKTFPLLLSSPLTSWQIVLAKLGVGALLLIILLSISAIFPLSMVFFGEVPLGLMFFSYMGAFLILMVYVSAGVLASSLTDSLIVSVVLSIVFSIGLLLLGVGQQLSSSLALKEAFRFLSLDMHFAYFRTGSLSLASLVLFLSLIGFFALLSERVIEFHRWR